MAPPRSRMGTCQMEPSQIPEWREPRPLGVGSAATIVNPVTDGSPGAVQPDQHGQLSAATPDQATGMGSGSTHIHLHRSRVHKHTQCSNGVFSLSPGQSTHTIPSPGLIYRDDSSYQSQSGTTNEAEGVGEASHTPPPPTGLQAATSQVDSPWLGFLPQPGVGAVPMDVAASTIAHPSSTTYSTSRGSCRTAAEVQSNF